MNDSRNQELTDISEEVYKFHLNRLAHAANMRPIVPGYGIAHPPSGFRMEMAWKEILVDEKPGEASKCACTLPLTDSGPLSLIIIRLTWKLLYLISTD